MPSDMVHLNPTLDQLRYQARRLLEGIHMGDPEALARFRATNPALAIVSDEALVQADLGNYDGLRVLARECGFPEWMGLTRHVAEGHALPHPGTLARLVHAVEAPAPDTVREILTNHPHLARARVYDKDRYAETGTTVLHCLYQYSSEDRATEGHLAVAQLLIDYGADVNATGGKGDICGETPLGAFGWGRSLRLVQFLLDHGANPNHVSDWGHDPVETVASPTRTAILEALNAAGAQVQPGHLLNAGLKEQLAAMLDQEPGLINKHVPLNRVYGTRGTLLNGATDQEDMVALLLAHGANVNAVDNRDRTPLHEALSDGIAAVVQMLLNHGATVDLTAAIGLGDKPRVIELLDQDKSLVQQIRPWDGWTPLHLAVHYDQPAMVAILLERGADVNAVSHAGDTPLDLAREGSVCAEMLS